MGLHALLIVNKSGGLVFHKQLSPGTSSLGTNELLRIGSTFHGLYAITRYRGGYLWEVTYAAQSDRAGAELGHRGHPDRQLHPQMSADTHR